jgi:hypothetical protein
MSNLPDPSALMVKHGVLVWLLWWAWVLVSVFGTFAIFETLALQTGGLSLSMFTWQLGAKFPLAIFAFGLVIGLLVGGLAVHFYWHWLPPGAVSSG